MAVDTTSVPEQELKQYDGNCHCGHFKFTISIPELPSVLTCDCSLDIRNGTQWIYPVSSENLKVHSGENGMKEYEFGNKDTSHYFCPKCGSSVYAVRKAGRSDMSIPYGFNARMLHDLPADLKENFFPGSTLPPFYTALTFPSITKEEEEKLAKTEDMKRYNGNCHCGAVRYSVVTKALEGDGGQEVLQCNCSLCSRNADLWIYPPASFVLLHSSSSLTDYEFLSKDSLHSFCSICGTSVLVKVLDEKEDLCPLNVRTIEGMDKERLEALKIKKYDGWKNEPKYVVK